MTAQTMGNHPSAVVVVEAFTAHQCAVTGQFAPGQLAVFAPLLGLHFYMLCIRRSGRGFSTGRTAQAVVAQGYAHVPRAVYRLRALLVNPRGRIVGEGDRDVRALLLNQATQFVVQAALFSAVGIGQARDFARRCGALLLRARLIALPGGVGFVQLAGQ